MSDKTPGFRGRSIEDVQAGLFLRDLPACNGRFRYPSAGLSADPGTVVLFQYRARIIASACFLRDDGGAIYLDAASIRTFDPLDVEAMRKAWPSFRAFGHVKQFLNPTRYSQFAKRLKHVTSPTAAALTPRGRGGRAASTTRRPRAEAADGSKRAGPKAPARRGA
jgi:hypothetical protein